MVYYKWTCDDDEDTSEAYATEAGYAGHRNQIKWLMEALQLAKTTQYTGVNQNRGDEKRSNPPRQTLKTPEKREVAQIGNLLTAATSAALTAVSSPAFFGGASNPATTSFEAKTKASPLDEKKRLQLHNELIQACKNGSFPKVKAAIDKGALVDVPEQDENPLYAAVYGMNSKVVSYLITQRGEGASAVSWQSCEEHNEECYEQTFLIMKFDPVTYEDWRDLLIQIEPNEFLVCYHLDQMKKAWGKKDVNCENFQYLKRYVSGDGVFFLRPERIGLWAGRSGLQKTRKGFEDAKEQIKQHLVQMELQKSAEQMAIEDEDESETWAIS